MKVIFHYAASPDLASRLSQLESDGLSVSVCAESDRGTFATLIPDTEVLWHLLEPVTAAVFDAAPKLRLVQKIGIGVNTIDLDAAKAHDVAVCNMPGTNSNAVAEMALLLMLTTLRKLHQTNSEIRQGRGWALPVAWQDGYGEVGGRTVGLVGYGAVPRLLAPVLSAMGARVLYSDVIDRPDAIGEARHLEALLAESDVVSLHVPLTPETEHFIDRESLALMKPGAILINTARGGLVDESALVAALQSGQLGAAGLDVFEAEPTPSDNPLFELDNVVLSPHVAWLTRETLERSIGVAAENCRRLAAGEDLLHRVV